MAKRQGTLEKIVNYIAWGGLGIFGAGCLTAAMVALKNLQVIFALPRIEFFVKPFTSLDIIIFSNGIGTTCIGIGICILAFLIMLIVSITRQLKLVNHPE